MRHVLLAIPLVFLACSVSRPLSLPAPTAAADEITYPALLVTDSVGRARWVYNVHVAADTLWGTLSPEASRPRFAMSLTQVRALATPRFSVGRTAGLIAGLASVVVAAALLAPDPVYSVGYR